MKILSEDKSRQMITPRIPTALHQAVAEYTRPRRQTISEFVILAIQEKLCRETGCEPIVSLEAEPAAV